MTTALYLSHGCKNVHSYTAISSQGFSFYLDKTNIKSNSSFSINIIWCLSKISQPLVDDITQMEKISY